MKRAFFVLGLLLVIALPARAGVERRERFDWDAAGVERLSVKHPVGRLEIIGTSSKNIEVEMDVRCGTFRWNCDDADDIELSNRRHGPDLDVEVEGYPHNGRGLSVDIRLRVPFGMHVEIERGVGDTIVRGLSGDVEIESGVGEIRVSTSERNVGSVHVESGVGSARLDVGDGRVRRDGFLFLGNEVDWRGSGKARIDLEVGVGSVHVDLDH